MKPKTERELAIMREGAKILRLVHQKTRELAVDGANTADLDTLAEQIIHDHGATPSFKGFHGFPASLCTMLNDEVVHGIPSDKQILRHGDLFSLDCGVYYKGYHTDAAYSLVVGGAAANPGRERFHGAVKEALLAGCRAAKHGAELKSVGKAVEASVKAAGYKVIRHCCGHGIGQQMHEDPSVYNFETERDNLTLKRGMTLCIEPIVARGNPKTEELSDGWTVVTKNGGDACQWEHCGIVTDTGLEILA